MRVGWFGWRWAFAVLTLVVAALLAWLAGSFPGAVSGGLLAMVAAVLGLMSSHAQEAALRSVRASAGGQGVFVGRVAGLDDLVALGVHPARRQEGADGRSSRLPPFVRRDLSGRIESSVREHAFVLVVGESTAGKSRAVLEALKAAVPDHDLIAPDPDDPASWTALLAELPKRRRCVVWLDDLERFFGLAGFTARSLQHLMTDARQVKIVATIRSQEKLKYTFVGSDTKIPDQRLAADIINLTHEIRLDRRWSAAELDRARGFTSDARIRDAIRSCGRYGLAESLAAGPQLLAAWQDAWAPEGHHVRGAALVAAAVDARRCGWKAPLPASLLERLHGLYLAAHGGPLLRPESWESAVEWATTPLFATSSMLLPSDAAGAFLVFDYLPDAADALPSAASIPAQTWDVVIDEADAPAKVEIGWEALRRACRQAAGRAFDQALDAGERSAAIGVARLLGDAREFRRACDVLRMALPGSDTDPMTEEELDLRSWLCWWTGQSGQIAEAHGLATDLNRRYRSEYGDADWKTIRSTITLARWTGHAGDTAAALTLAQDALARAEALHAERESATMNARFEVAVWTAHTGRLDHAAELWAALDQDACVLYGRNDSGWLDARWNRAAVVRQLGRTDLALELMKDVVNGRVTCYGPDHPRSLHARLQLSGWLGDAGQIEPAKTAATDTTADCLSALGPDHELTLAGRHQTALWTLAAGHTESATRQFRDLLHNTRHTLGDSHPLTEDCRKHIEDPRWNDGYYLPDTW